MNKKLKLWAGLAVIVILIVGFVWWWRYYRPYDITVGWENVTNDADVYRYARSLVSAYEKDTVGFDTPEATFDAFREALKAGDYELASKYFVVEKQKEMERSFDVSEKNGFIGKQVELLFLPNTKTVLFDDQVRFRANDAYGHSFSYDLVKNIYTGISNGATSSVVGIV